MLHCEKHTITKTIIGVQENSCLHSYMNRAINDNTLQYESQCTNHQLAEEHGYQTIMTDDIKINYGDCQSYSGTLDIANSK